MPNKQISDVLIVGAGAAGLMCASQAAKSGLKVTVLEKSNRPGKKILRSGGGRCNFTNLYASAEHYLSDNPHFCKSALDRYTAWDFKALVDKHKIAYHEKELGQLFCNLRAKEIVNMLLAECAEYGVEILLNTAIKTVDFKTEKVTVTSEQGLFESNSLVIASGGLSVPSLGGSDFGYRLAEQLGLSLTARRAGLVPLVFSDAYRDLFAALSGLSVTAEVSCNGQSFLHQVLFTHRGLSGPAILQISNYWQAGDLLVINLLPQLNQSQFLQVKQQQGQQKIIHWLASQLPKKLARSWLQQEFPQWLEKNWQSMKKSQLIQLLEKLQSWTLKPAGSEGYRTAEVTLGGVDTRHLSSQTMACKNRKNLYFIGEVVDVTGWLGGFNFQWAWSSAHAAACDLAKNKTV